MASTIRTFIAIELDAPVIAAAEALVRQLSREHPEYRWNQSERFHITLKFLGDVPNTEIPDICRVAKKIAQQHDPFSITIRGLGAFPSPQKPRVVWLGVDDGREELVAIHQQLDEAFAEMRFDRERNEFTPHLTLAYLARNHRWTNSMTESISSSVDLKLGVSEVGQIVVYSSHSQRHGPIYTPMSRVKLA